MARFCTDCGSELQERDAFGRVRGVCPKCGHVHFDDPKVAVGAVVDLDGRIVLCRRNHEPQMGRWSFPSGYVDAGEVIEEAAAREVEEETGLKVKVQRLLGVYSDAGNRTVFIAYAAEAFAGKLEAGDECFEVKAFAPEELPEMAFPNDGAIVEAWAEGRRGK